MFNVIFQKKSHSCCLPVNKYLESIIDFCLFCYFLSCLDNCPLLPLNLKKLENSRLITMCVVHSEKLSYSYQYERQCGMFELFELS